MNEAYSGRWLDVVMVGLVNHYVGALRQLLQERFEILPPRQRAGGVVGIADVHQARGGVDRRQHALQIVGVLIGQGHRDHGGVALLGEAAEDVERRQRRDDLRARTEKGVGGHSQRLGQSAPEHDAVRRDAVQAGESALQRVRLVLRVALCRSRDGFLEHANHAWRRTVAVLVAIQPEHAAGAAHRRNNRLEGSFSEGGSGSRGRRSGAKSTQKTPACDRHEATGLST